MKKLEKKRKLITETLAKINRLARHIRNVEDNCVLMGTKLIEMGNIELGKQLIANGMVHDASKFYGIEFENLSGEEHCKEETAKLKLRMSIHQHNSTNLHHPEAWAGGIKTMPNVYLAECVADWKSRSEEFGESLRDYINDKATKRWDFDKNDDIYKQIMEFVDLVCDKPFEQLTQG
jgi:hypothetical protein